MASNKIVTRLQQYAVFYLLGRFSDLYILINILNKNSWMFGTFVPISAGHLPIDFHQEKEYNLFER
jgi:hypothetical protein